MVFHSERHTKHTVRNRTIVAVVLANANAVMDWERVRERKNVHRYILPPLTRCYSVICIVCTASYPWHWIKDKENDKGKQYRVVHQSSSKQKTILSERAVALKQVKSKKKVLKFCVYFFDRNEWTRTIFWWRRSVGRQFVAFNWNTFGRQRDGIEWIESWPSGYGGRQQWHAIRWNNANNADDTNDGAAISIGKWFIFAWQSSVSKMVDKWIRWASSEWNEAQLHGPKSSIAANELFEAGQKESVVGECLAGDACQCWNCTVPSDVGRKSESTIDAVLTFELRALVRSSTNSWHPIESVHPKFVDCSQQSIVFDAAATKSVHVSNIQSDVLAITVIDTVAAINTVVTGATTCLAKQTIFLQEKLKTISKLVRFKQHQLQLQQQQQRKCLCAFYMKNHIFSHFLSFVHFNCILFIWKVHADFFYIFTCICYEYYFFSFV